MVGKTLRVQELGAAGILDTAIAVPIPPGRVIFQRQQALVAVDWGYLPTGADGGVGQAGGPVASQTFAGQAVDAEVDVLLEQRPASIGAAAARPRIGVVSAQRARRTYALGS